MSVRDIQLPTVSVRHKYCWKFLHPPFPASGDGFSTWCMFFILVHVLDCGLTFCCTAALIKSRFNLWTEQLYPASGSWQVQLNRTSRAQCFFSWASQLCSRGGLAALAWVSILRQASLVWPGELDVCMAQPLEDSCARGDRAGTSSKGLLAGTHLGHLTWRGEEMSFMAYLSTVSSAFARNFFSTQALSSLFFLHRHKASKKPQLAPCCANNSDISAGYWTPSSKDGLWDISPKL